MSLADISRLIQEQLKTFVMDDLSKIIVAEVAKANNGRGVDDRTVAREK